MENPENVIELCPDMILDNVGDSFVLGIGGGSAFHFIRGIYNSSTGARLSGGLENVRMNAHKVGGGFAVWGGLFSTFVCAIEYARQKDDAWNSIVAGAASGGLLTLRQGFRASRNGALYGGALTTLVVGAVTAVNRFVSGEGNEEAFMGDDAALLPPGVHMGQVFGQSGPETFSASEAGSGSWFGGLLGSGKKKETGDKSGSTKILESFDASHVPTDEFN